MPRRRRRDLLLGSPARARHRPPARGRRRLRRRRLGQSHALRGRQERDRMRDRAHVAALHPRDQSENERHYLPAERPRRLQSSRRRDRHHLRRLKQCPHKSKRRRCDRLVDRQGAGGRRRRREREPERRRRLRQPPPLALGCCRRRVRRHARLDSCRGLLWAPDQRRGAALRRTSHYGKQRGFALILMAMVVIMGITWYALSAIGKAAPQGYERDQVTAAALKKAKEALLAYVVTAAAMTTDSIDSRHANPGRLPCPESLSHPGTTNEGVAADLTSGYTCGTVGRLPWKSLGVDQIRDGYGEPLWYAVPLGTWAKTASATTLTINPGLANQLTYDGTANSVVAVIIAPGAGLNTTGAGTPSGSCNGFATVNQLTSTRNSVPLLAANYLECGNATGANYTTIGTSPWSND